MHCTYDDVFYAVLFQHIQAVSECRSLKMFLVWATKPGARAKYRPTVAVGFLVMVLFEGLDLTNELHQSKLLRKSTVPVSVRHVGRRLSLLFTLRQVLLKMVSAPMSTM